MKFYFISFLSAFLLSTHTYAVDVLAEETREFDSHKGIIGNYTHTQRIIHDPSKIAAYKSKITLPPKVTSEEVIPEPFSYGDSRYQSLGMRESKIIQNEDIILHTSGMVDCIGISVWDPHTKTAALYHASKMELREDQYLFQEYFINPLLTKIPTPSTAQVNLISSYWSEDLLTVFRLMQEGGFQISGLSVPDAVIEEDEFSLNKYINKETTPPVYHDFSRAPHSTMVINTNNGKVGIKLPE